MTATQEIRLEGAANFRDIGGCEVGDGRRVKRGHIFRSGELSHLTDSDLDILRGLGIALVADLRSQRECGLHPSRWPEELATEWLMADIPMDIYVDGQRLIDLLRDDPAPASVARLVGRSFPVIADTCGAALRIIVESVARGVEPVLFHCTNGRDRTGAISALLLHLLGAPRDAIVADFMTTNRRIDVERVIANTLDTFHNGLGFAISRESVESVTLVRPEYIDAMFQGLERKYGTAEGYFDHFGITEPLRQVFRDRLLEIAS